MKLRTKTSLTLFGTTAATVAIVLLCARMILMHGFLAVEGDSVRRDIAQVVDSLEREVDDLRAHAKDWASWDDAYRFVLDRNDDFVKRNLDPETFTLESVDLALFFNTDGELVYGGVYDGGQSGETAVPPGLVAQVKNDRLLVQRPNETSSVAGFLMTDSGPLLIAAYPILTSESKGPVQGTLLFAQRIDDAFVKSVSDMLRTPLGLFPPDAASLPLDVQQAKESLDTSDTPVVSILDDERVAGYAQIRDVHGIPIFIARMEKPRAIYAQAKDTLYYFGLCVAVTGLTQVLAMVMLLGATVVTRLGRLHRGLQRVEAAANPALRVPEEGRDEVAEVSQSVNRMLRALEGAETAVITREAQLRGLVENATDGIITTDETGRILSFNRAAEGIFGYEAREVMGRNVMMLMPEPNRGRHDAYISTYLETGKRSLMGTGRDLLAVKKDGVIFPIYITLSEVRVGPDRTFTAIIRDITERKRYEELLTHAATYDALTGLMNRRYFDEELAVAINSAKRYGHAMCLCVCDLDLFKGINDQYGHRAGDEVLKKAGEIIRHEIRKEDIGARIGGDEFCICFTHSPGIEAVTCTERIRQTLASHVFHDDAENAFSITATFGLADLTTRDMDGNALFDLADRALYAAKQQGGNRSMVNVA